jgi:hypothetical protein
MKQSELKKIMRDVIRESLNELYDEECINDASYKTNTGPFCKTQMTSQPQKTQCQTPEVVDKHSTAYSEKNEIRKIIMINTMAKNMRAKYSKIKTEKINVPTLISDINRILNVSEELLIMHRDVPVEEVKHYK